MPIPWHVIPASQFASSEETRAGTADNKAVTPRALHAALRNMGLISGVNAAHDSTYMRIDMTNTVPLPPDWGGHAIMQFHPNDELKGSVRMPVTWSGGTTQAWLKILVGNTIGFIPVFLSSKIEEG